MYDNQYEGYTAMDFLKDEDFLRWQLMNNEEETLFWNDVIDQDPHLASVIEDAIMLCKANVRLNDFSMTPAEISESQDALHQIINSRKKKKARYIALRYIAAAACIIAVVLPFLWDKKDVTQDIVAFAKSLPEADFNAKDTRLILGEDKVIALSNKESSVQYGVDDIVADDHIILKEENLSYNQLITPYGKRSTITFSDGTKVWINAGTKLVYPDRFSKDKREIYVNGEIYIEVAADKTRPFLVKTKQMDIMVLGTKFNVSAYEADNTNSVALLSGSVRISGEHKKDVVLEPNQIYSDIGGSPFVKNEDASIYAIWTQGLYHFESENLGDIVLRLERYYGVKIECNANIAKLKCSGKLDLKDDLNTLLTELTRALPIKYWQNSDDSYIIQ